MGGYRVNFSYEVVYRFVISCPGGVVGWFWLWVWRRRGSRSREGGVEDGSVQRMVPCRAWAEQSRAEGLCWPPKSRTRHPQLLLELLELLQLQPRRTRSSPTLKIQLLSKAACPSVPCLQPYFVFFWTSTPPGPRFGGGVLCLRVLRACVGTVHACGARL